jgi:hypothetical protein
MAPRQTALSLARRIVAAAADLTADDPNRAVAIEAILGHLDLARDEATVGALFEAIERGWLKVNDGPSKHTVVVGPAWLIERARAGRSDAKPQAGRKAAGGAGGAGGAGAPKRRKR